MDTPTTAIAAPPTAVRERFRRWAGTRVGETTLAAAFLFALTLAVFGRVLFGPGDIVLSNVDADLALQFVHWRYFGFRELHAGHLALWNPHIFSGTPYFGGFQSALLYPPNWLYLCLPLARAINVGIALHVFLAGFFMYLWTRRRGLHPLACVFAGVLFMFCGPFFPHIYAGHLPNLCTMVWGPLLFLAIDGWLERRTPGFLLLGAGVVACQVLAGHPQYVFYTGVAAAVYCALQLAVATRRVSAVLGLAAMAAGGAALSAAQLFEGFHAAGQSVRSIGISIEFAATFSFPPENFLTMLVPGFFGDMTASPYWGRFYLWEMSLFFGVTGLVMACYGAFQGERDKRRFCAAVALLMVVFALGEFTPLFEGLYDYAPGFNKFRGWSKFTYPAVLFLIMLAAVGFDRMLRRGAAGRGTAVTLFTLGGLLLVGAGLAFATVHRSGPLGPWPWTWWLEAMHRRANPLTWMTAAEKLSFYLGIAAFAGKQMLFAAAVTLALGAVILIARRRPRALVLVLGIALVETLVFARSSFKTFPLEEAIANPATKFLRRQPPGDFRILNKEHANLAMTTGERDLWGYDPGVLLRYAEWIATTQGLEADDATQGLLFEKLPPTFVSLLRCRYVFTSPAEDAPADQINVEQPRAPQGAQRLRLVPRVRLMHGRDTILAALNDPAFDPAANVILETPPDPAPVEGGSPGTARVVAETTDSLTVEAHLPQAAVLLVSDTYCTGWRVRSLLPPGRGGQPRYDVLPADYFLRGIPLAAGDHRFVLEYWPRAFVVGAWTSGISLAAYLAALVSWMWRGKMRVS